jgi:hypothetical protein
MAWGWLEPPHLPHTTDSWAVLSNRSNCDPVRGAGATCGPSPFDYPGANEQ